VPTELIFREDAYQQETEAKVLSINDRQGIILDRTVFYGAGGGQPGDTGRLKSANGETAVATAVYGADRSQIIHVPAEDQPLPEPGETLTAAIDWDRRHRLMRIHTALHLLSVVLPFPVTGGQIKAEEGRLDFDLDGTLAPKDELAARLNELVKADHPVNHEWITDDELMANPSMVKTMKVMPPMGTGRVRLIRIGDIDLQPCGGTHVRSTGEIGEIFIGKIQSKGRQNRRVRIRLEDPS
jgi:misacylated tRNA(Ala) deacylase